MPTYTYVAMVNEHYEIDSGLSVDFDNIKR